MSSLSTVPGDFMKIRSGGSLARWPSRPRLRQVSQKRRTRRSTHCSRPLSQRRRQAGAASCAWHSSSPPSPIIAAGGEAIRAYFINLKLAASDHKKPSRNTGTVVDAKSPPNRGRVKNDIALLQ
jgi:hypothetical protein